ncbi:MAG TPA: FtsW/RodA/SpoVE family cell cycle protein [Planctomycetota bacterium]|nr:FtsW/RodA/SpoVE family cell cycle protein [Planctomycetota bacterium]
MKGAAWHPKRSSALERILSVRHLRWLEVDWHVLLVALGLLSIGLALIHSMDAADTLWGRDYGSSVHFERHLITVILASPAFAIGLFLRPRWVRRNAPLLYAAALLLLVIVFVPGIGSEHNNATRWIKLPLGFDLQPSEVAKLGVILMLASALHQSRLKKLSDWMRPALFALVPMGLVAVQPDLGTAMTLAPISLGMFYVAGVPGRRILGLLVSVALLGVLAFQVGLLHDYQLQRVDTWLESWNPAPLIHARNGAAFHTYHARVAIGNGGWLGEGLGLGVVNEAAHLPERDCDSIFAVAAEAGGFVGTSGLIALYALLIILIFHSASQLRERFSRLVVSGIGFYFAAHLFVNVGVNLGLVPMTGMTLPLLSTGGSSLATSFLALGLVLGLSSHHEPTLDKDAFHE